MIDISHYVQHIKKEKYTIFLFHGVIDKPCSGIRNYTKKHLLKKDFEKLLINLKKIGKPISLDEVINFHQERVPLPDFSYSITFDDGFENNFTIAKPILEKLSTPSTFYISTNLIENNLMTWIDQIEYCIDKVSNKSFKLPWDKKVFEITSNKSKIDFLNSIRKNVKSDPGKFAPQDIVKHIFDFSEVTMIISNDGILDKKMNWQQVQQLHNHELFSVGGHSHNHVSLGLLKHNIMEKEIQKSLEYLHNKASISTPHYSYPEGQKIDFNSNVKRALENHDIKCCPSAINGINDNILCSLFDLKRITVV